jgi:hypothetical protein
VTNDAVAADDDDNNNNNNRGNWNHHQTIQKIPQQHAGKAGNQGITKSSHTGHYAQISESTDVKVPNIQKGEENITYSIDCNYNIIIIWIEVQFRAFATWRHCNQCG